jgi:hypothetical protein
VVQQPRRRYRIVIYYGGGRKSIGKCKKVKKVENGGGENGQKRVKKGVLERVLKVGSVFLA